MSESLENAADCSFTFDTSLSAEFDLTMYAGIIYELAVLPPKQRKCHNEELFPDLNAADKDNDSIKHDDDGDGEDVDMNQTHLTDEFNQIFSYFDEDVEELTDNSDDELNQFYSDLNEFSDDRQNEIDDFSDKEYDGHKKIKDISNDDFQSDIDNQTDTVRKAMENFIAVSDEKPYEIVSADYYSNNESFNNLSRELGVGNVREKVLMYNKMLDEINENLLSEKKVFRKKIEENIAQDNKLIEYHNAHGNDNYIIETLNDFDLLSKYVKKLSSIESYAQILSRLNRLVNAISQLDKTRLDGMNLKSLKNFLYFIKIYSDECVNMSSAIRKDIAIDLEKNLLSHEDLLYCLDVVANEVKPLCHLYHVIN